MNGNETENSVVEAAAKTMAQLIPEFLDSTLGKLVIAVVIALLTVWLARIFGRVISRVANRQKDRGHKTVISFLRYLVIFLVYFIGVSLIASLFPQLNETITKVLAAGGIVAVVGGLAAQEALGRLVGGIMILFCKPFAIGDTICYFDGNVTGVVEEITLNHTVIRTGENKRVIVPNNKASSAVIENANYNDPKVCVYLDFKVTADTNLPLAKQSILRVALAHPLLMDTRTQAQKENGEDAVQVRVTEITTDGIALRAFVWAENGGDAGVLKSDLLQATQEEFEKQGIRFANSNLVVNAK